MLYIQSWQQKFFFLLTTAPRQLVRKGGDLCVNDAGTWITEWAEGSAACVEAFSQVATAKRLAQQLASLAKHFAFDGWFINIENNITVPFTSPSLGYSYSFAFLSFKIK